MKQYVFKEINVDELKVGNEFKVELTNIDPLYTVTDINTNGDIFVTSSVTGVSKLNKQVVKTVHVVTTVNNEDDDKSID